MRIADVSTLNKIEETLAEKERSVKAENSYLEDREKKAVGVASYGSTLAR